MPTPTDPARAPLIVSARRSPFGRYLGALAPVDPLDLARQIGGAALTGLPEAARQALEVYVGNCIPSAFASPSTVGRQIALALGLPRFATTIDTACCASLTALRQAVAAIRLADSDGALVLGVESMSRTAHLAHGLRAGVKAGAVTLVDPISPIEYAGHSSVAQDASDGAERHGVTRQEMDAWAARSHERALAALADGRFPELTSVAIKGPKGTTLLERDETPRPDTSAAKLAGLRPVFGTRHITAGNAPGLNDGAAALVVLPASRAQELGLRPLARIVAQAAVTAEPAGIAWVPAHAITAVCARAGVAVGDLDLLEINEAFAAMPLVSTKVLAQEHGLDWERLKERTNLNGGAVALGHPVGASGLRILMALASELRRRGGGRGVAAICGGLAQGEAVLIEVERDA